MANDVLYADLPAYVRGSDWYASQGSDAKVVIPHNTWNGLLQDARRLGSENEAGFVLVGYQPENPLAMLITDYELISKGDTKSMRASGAEYLRSVSRALGRLNNVEQALGLPREKKVIVGGAHTHPGHGVFLSSRDQESLREFMMFAKKNSKLYSFTDGNLEIVTDPLNNQSEAFKLSPQGYETVNVYVKNIEDCLKTLQ